MTRVAALQFASGTSVADNLATCLRMIDQACEQGAELLVMPEFCNHISWYDDHDHAERVAVAPGDDFLGAIAYAARQHGCYLVINVSLRNAGTRPTVSSLMYGPTGELLGRADKQTLMGHENVWFERASEESPVMELPFGRVGMFPCRDGVTFETPRGLALRGAQLFCDSLNSFALDEASLHVPARAQENGCFLVAANKVGPLIPQELISAVSAETHIPERFLSGAGESQVVSPDGTVLARGPAEGEAVVCAEIDLELATSRRPDGSDPLRDRRPALFGPIARGDSLHSVGKAGEEVRVATLCPQSNSESELADLLASLSPDTRLAVLPELYGLSTGWEEHPATAVAASTKLLEGLQRLLQDRPSLTLCTSLIRSGRSGPVMTGVLVNASGILFEQPQLQVAKRHQGLLAAGSEFTCYDLPWARVAVLVGEDAVHPEYAKLAALAGAHLLLVPFDLQETWEMELGLPSRSAENRVCVVASSRAREGRAGLIADLEEDFTLMTPWQQRSFDGYINQPIVTRQSVGEPVTSAVIHPTAATNKLMSQDTDLLADRPWRLCGQLVKVDTECHPVANG